MIGMEMDSNCGDGAYIQAVTGVIQKTVVIVSSGAKVSSKSDAKTGSYGYDGAEGFIKTVDENCGGGGWNRRGNSSGEAEEWLKW